MELLEQAKGFLADKVANMAKPEASVTDVDFKGLGLGGITLLAKTCVFNPYFVPIPICEIDYKVKSAGNVIASGSIPDPGSIAANDKTMLDVTIKLPHSLLISLIRDVGADWDIDYELAIGLIVDIPVFGNVTVPISYKGQMKLPTISEMIMGKSSDADADVKTAADAKAEADVKTAADAKAEADVKTAADAKAEADA